MADLVADLVADLIATTPLSGYERDFGGTRLAELTEQTLLSLACPLGGDKAFDALLRDTFETARPGPGASVVGKARVIWTAPDQVMAFFPEGALTVQTDAAYMTDQSDNWCMLTVVGPLARAALERICPLDIHPDVFAVNAAARTVMEHMGVFIIRTEEDEFLLMSASSSAHSFLHALEVSLNNVA